MRTNAWVLVTLAACSGGGNPQELHGPPGEVDAGQPEEVDAAPPQTDAPPALPPHAWGAPRMIADGVYRLEAEGDDAGVVTAMWSVADVGPDQGLWSSTFQPGHGWDAPVMLQAADSEIGIIDLEPRAGGAALAAWTAWHEGGPYKAYASHRTLHGWGAITRLDVDDANGVRDLSIAVEPDGDAVAAWVVANYPDYDLLSRRYHAGVGWGPALRVTVGPSHALTAQVTVDAYGTATILYWQYRDPDPGVLMSVRADPHAPWSAPAPIVQSSNPLRPLLVVDDDLALGAVWTDFHSISAARFSAGGWGPAAVISNVTGFTGRARIDGDRHGRIVAAWAESEPASAAAWTNRFDGTSWAGPVLLESGGAEYQNPDVGLDASGRALAVWGQRAGGAGVVRASQAQGAGWGPAVDISTHDGFAQEARVAVAADGSAQALWLVLQPMDGPRWSLWTAAYE